MILKGEESLSAVAVLLLGSVLCHKLLCTIRKKKELYVKIKWNVKLVLLTLNHKIQTLLCEKLMSATKLS